MVIVLTVYWALSIKCTKFSFYIARNMDCNGSICRAAHTMQSEENRNLTASYFKLIRFCLQDSLETESRTVSL